MIWKLVEQLNSIELLAGIEENLLIFHFFVLVVI